MTWTKANEILDTLSRDDALAPERTSAPEAPPLSTVNVRIDAQSVKYHARKYRCDNPHKANGSHPVGSLARTAGVSAAQLTGEAKTPLYKVETLAALLGCTADDLIETAEGKRMNPTPWTEADDRTIIDDQHLGKDALAKKLGRTPSAVVNRANILRTRCGMRISLVKRDPEPKAPAPETQPDASPTPADTSVDTGRCTDDCANEPCEGHCTDPEHFAEVAGEDPEEPSEGTDETHSLDEAMTKAAELSKSAGERVQSALDEHTSTGEQREVVIPFARQCGKTGFLAEVFDAAFGQAINRRRELIIELLEAKIEIASSRVAQGADLTHTLDRGAILGILDRCRELVGELR